MALESLKTHGLLPPRELYDAYLQFWRRPDDEEIFGSVYQKSKAQDPRVRYRLCSVLKGNGFLDHFAPYKFRGDKCWGWDKWSNSFCVDLEIGKVIPCCGPYVSALTAVACAIGMEANYTSRSIFLQRVPCSRCSANGDEEIFSGMVFRLDLNGCFGWNETDNKFWLFVHKCGSRVAA